MNEQYKKLYEFNNHLYSNTSPVLIMAGALSLNSVTNKLLIQLKFKNISKKSIKALTVEIELMDTAKRVVDNRVTYQYLDLNANRDEEFGSKSPIYISNKLVRYFNVKVTECIFTDGEIWNGKENSNWESLPNTVLLSSYFQDEELAKQYGIYNKYPCTFVPKKFDNLWLCTCGQINHDDEDTCHYCNLKLKQLEESLDTNILENLKKERLMKEKEKMIEEQKTKSILKKKRKKKLKNLLILSTPFLLILIALGIFIGLNSDKLEIYFKAKQLYDELYHAEAFMQFTKIDNFLNSEKYIDKIITGDIYYDDLESLYIKGMTRAADKHIELLENETHNNPKYKDTIYKKIFDSEDYRPVEFYISLLAIIGEENEIANNRLQELKELSYVNKRYNLVGSYRWHLDFQHDSTDEYIFEIKLTKNDIKYQFNAEGHDITNLIMTETNDVIEQKINDSSKIETQYEQGAYFREILRNGYTIAIEENYQDKEKYEVVILSKYHLSKYHIADLIITFTCDNNSCFISNNIDGFSREELTYVYLESN